MTEVTPKLFKCACGTPLAFCAQELATAKSAEIKALEEAIVAKTQDCFFIKGLVWAPISTSVLRIS